MSVYLTSTSLLVLISRWGCLQGYCISGRQFDDDWFPYSKHLQPWEARAQGQWQRHTAEKQVKSSERNADNTTRSLNLPILFNTNRCRFLLHRCIVVLVCISSVYLPGVPRWPSVATVAVPIHRLIFYRYAGRFFIFRLLVRIARQCNIIFWIWGLHGLWLEVLYQRFGLCCCVVCVIAVKKNVSESTQ